MEQRVLQYIVLAYEDGIETVTWDGYWFREIHHAIKHEQAMRDVGHEHTIVTLAWWEIPWRHAVPESDSRPVLRLIRGDG